MSQCFIRMSGLVDSIEELNRRHNCRANVAYANETLVNIHIFTLLMTGLKVHIAVVYLRALFYARSYSLYILMIQILFFLWQYYTPAFS